MELRKAPRKTLYYPAWIDIGDGSAPRDCMIYDISATGARLTVAGDQQVPDNFNLFLARDRSTQRRCQTAWRSGLNVGVKFLRDPSSVKLDC